MIRFTPPHCTPFAGSGMPSWIGWASQAGLQTKEPRLACYEVLEQRTTTLRPKTSLGWHGEADGPARAHWNITYRR